MATTNVTVSDQLTVIAGNTEEVTITATKPNNEVVTLEFSNENPSVSIISLGNQYEVNQNITKIVEAGQTISGNTVVSVFDNIASYADKDTNVSGQIGVAMNAAMQNSNIEVTFSGVVTEPTWNFTNNPIFLGSNGQLTQEKPTSGTVVLIGYPITSTSFLINIQKLYKR